jgi:hypothetical protein
MVERRPVAANLPTPWLGVTERVKIYGYMLWPCWHSFYYASEILRLRAVRLCLPIARLDEQNA